MAVSVFSGFVDPGFGQGSGYGADALNGLMHERLSQKWPPTWNASPLSAS